MHDEIVPTEYEDYARNALVQLRRVREGTQIEEDHMRNRQMIVGWLIAHTAAIDVRTRDGKTYYVMADAAAFRDGRGRLLAEVQRIKSEGDYDGGAGAVRDATVSISTPRFAMKSSRAWIAFSCRPTRLRDAAADAARRAARSSMSRSLSVRPRGPDARVFRVRAPRRCPRDRLPPHAEINPLTRALAALRAAGRIDRSDRVQSDTAG